MKYYAGIGSRETPPEVQNLMTLFASRMEQEGWILRSGGASGADSAFEHGIEDPKNMEIYLPNYSFNGKHSYNHGYYNFSKLKGWEGALETVHKFHPAPHKLSGFSMCLMARNAMQVLGADLQSPSTMVVCWTPEAKPVGGTSQAMRIAAHYNIPVFNLADQKYFDYVAKSLCRQSLNRHNTP